MNTAGEVVAVISRVRLIKCLKNQERLSMGIYIINMYGVEEERESEKTLLRQL